MSCSLNVRSAIEHQLLPTATVALLDVANQVRELDVRRVMRAAVAQRNDVIQRSREGVRVRLAVDPTPADPALVLIALANLGEDDRIANRRGLLQRAALLVVRAASSIPRVGILLGVLLPVVPLAQPAPEMAALAVLDVASSIKPVPAALLHKRVAVFAPPAIVRRTPAARVALVLATLDTARRRRFLALFPPPLVMRTAQTTANSSPGASSLSTNSQ